MAGHDEEQMQEEVRELFASARSRELTPADFAARLEALHARFLGSDADRSEMVRLRQDATTAYDDLVAGTDMDRHHHLERLAQALDLAPAP